MHEGQIILEVLGGFRQIHFSVASNLIHQVQFAGVNAECCAKNMLQTSAGAGIKADRDFIIGVAVAIGILLLEGF